MIGCNLFYIEAIKPYPENYEESLEITKMETGTNTGPELTRTAKVSGTNKRYARQTRPKATIATWLEKAGSTAGN